METLNLILNVGTNKALNADGVTALRSISLVQGETYKVNLKFVGGDVPSIDVFAFYLRKENSSTNLISATSATSQDGDYPYYFTLNVASPSLAASLQGDTTPLKAYLSWTAGAELELIGVFTANVIRASNSGGDAGYVSTLNGLSADLTLVGAGSVSVSQSGQNITISGEQGATDDYFPNGSGIALQGSVAALEAQSGTYYPRSNPSGYISTLPADIVRTTGNQTISGNKTFAGVIFSNNLGGIDVNTSIDLLGGVLYDADNGVKSIDWGGRKLQDEDEGIALDWQNHTLFGNWNLGPATGIFATAANLATSGANLQGQITTLTSATGTYYPRTNPSGYVGSSALAGFVATTGNQTVSGNKTFAGQTVFNGLVTFNTSNPIFGSSSNPRVHGINTSSNTVAIDVDSKQLKGSWSDDNGHTFSSTQQFNTAVGLSAIIPAADGIPANAMFNVGAIPSNGDTFEVNINGTDVIYEFNDTSDPGDGHIWISTEDIIENSLMASAIAAAIQSTFNSYIAGGVVTVSDAQFSFSTSNADSSAVISWNASSFFVDNTNGSATGIDATPESGTRESSILSDSRQIFITSIILKAPTDTAWTTADIAIGYLDAGNVFTPVWGIQCPPLGASAGIYKFMQKDFLIYSDAAFNLIQTPPSNCNLIARTVAANSDGNTSLDEDTGSSIYITVQGYAQ